MKRICCLVAAAGLAGCASYVPSPPPRVGVVRVSASRDAAALHLRMTVRNDSRKPWRVDTSRQLVQLPGERWTAPSGATLPVVEVAPGERQTIDLYYPLPDARRVPEFIAAWEVRAGNRTIEGRTPFFRAPG